MSEVDAVLQHVDRDLDGALDRLFAVMCIKSISTDPAYAEECRKNAEWHAADLAAIGFDAAVRPTPGHPDVLGHARGGSGPSALFYGHYDVQPVDPLELWENDPFEPSIATLPARTKVIRGRGLADDKGQLMAFVEACRAWKAVTGRLPMPLTVLLGDAGPRLLIAGLFVLTAVLGQLISNTATALIVIPIGVAASTSMGVSPAPVLMSTAVAAAASFLTPIATPTNLMVMRPGGYEFSDQWKLGLPLVIWFFIVSVFVVPLIWRF